MSVIKEFKAFRKARLSAEFRKFREKAREGKIGPIGPAGPQGARGSQGISGASMQGPAGPIGLAGERGLQGLSGASGATGLSGTDGVDGSTPDHEWKGESLRFQNPDGTWGKWVDLKGSGGGGGGSADTVKVNLIAGTTYSVHKNELIPGTNVFSFSHAGDVTVILPKNPGKNKLIELRHEDCTKNLLVSVAD